MHEIFIKMADMMTFLFKNNFLFITNILCLQEIGQCLTTFIYLH